MSSIFRRAKSQLIGLMNGSLSLATIAVDAWLFTTLNNQFNSNVGVQLNAKTPDQLSNVNARITLTGPGATFPRGYLSGLRMSRASAVAVSIATGQCRSDDDVANLYVTATLTCTITLNGANGLDVGARSNNTSYYVYVIRNPTTGTVASLMSLSPTAPTMPAGFTQKRRVGACCTGAPDIHTFNQVWEGRTRRVWYLQDAQGIATQSLTGLTTFTAISLAGRVPVTAKNIILFVAFAPGGAGALTDAAFFRAEGGTSSDGPTKIRRGVTLSANQLGMTVELPCGLSGGMGIESKLVVAANSGSIRIAAYDDEL